MSQAENYFINNPIFVKYKKRFSFAKLRSGQVLKSVNINERIIEIPFAIQAVADLPRQAKILDLGCTESPLPLQLAGLGYQVTGFDFREYPYQHPNLTFVRGDITQLPFDHETFDSVMSISTIEHIGIGFYDDPREGQDGDQKAMAQILRVLKQDGSLVLTVPYGVGEQTAHQRIYNEKTLRHLLEAMKVQDIRYFKTFRPAQSDCNTWVETSQKEASTIESPRQTQAVCLVKAKKIANT